MPTLQHYVVESWRTVLRTGHPVAVFHLMEHLSVRHTWEVGGGEETEVTWIGNPAVGDQLGEQDAETPDIRLDAEP